VGAVLHELAEEEVCSTLDQISPTRIVAAAHKDMALEVLLLKQHRSRGLSPKDGLHADARIAVETLWQRVINQGADVAYFPPAITFVVGRRLSKKQGGMLVADWARLLHWACSMSAVTPTWSSMVDQIIGRAKAAGRASQLLDVFTDIPMNIPAEVAARLVLPSEVEAKLRQAAAPTWSVGTLSFDTLRSHTPSKESDSSLSSLKMVKPLDVEAMPEYELAAVPTWVATNGGAQQMHAALLKLIDGIPCDDRLLVGIDTEWGTQGKSPGSAPSVIQLAAGGEVWVVDTVRPCQHISLVVEWLFQCERVAPIGFAFAQDAEKLAALSTSPGTAQQLTPRSILSRVIDLQWMAIEREPALRSRPPGLKALAGLWLGQRLNKTCQCSDWDARPLSAAQVRYAAADATVLLDIAKAMGIEEVSAAMIQRCTRYRL